MTLVLGFMLTTDMARVSYGKGKLRLGLGLG